MTSTLRLVCRMLHRSLTNIVVRNHLSVETFVSAPITMMKDLTSDPSDVSFPWCVLTSTTKYVDEDIVVLKIQTPRSEVDKGDPR